MSATTAFIDGDKGAAEHTGSSGVSAYEILCALIFVLSLSQLCKGYIWLICTVTFMMDIVYSFFVLLFFFWLFRLPYYFADISLNLKTMKSACRDVWNTVSRYKLLLI